MGSIIGGIAGLIGGAAGTTKKPPSNPISPSLYQAAWLQANPRSATQPNGATSKQLKSIADLGFALDDFGGVRGFYNDRLAGKDFLTDDDLAALMGPGMARNAADARTARQRATERGTNLGVGARSGVMERTYSDIDRAQLGADRASWNTLEQQRALGREQSASSAAAALAALLQGDQSFRQSEEDRKYAADLARSQHLDWWQNALVGAAEGFTGTELGTPKMQASGMPMTSPGGMFSAPSFGTSAAAYQAPNLGYGSWDISNAAGVSPETLALLGSRPSWSVAGLSTR